MLIMKTRAVVFILIISCREYDDFKDGDVLCRVMQCTVVVMMMMLAIHA
jgi:hypothetical protein